MGGYFVRHPVIAAALGLVVLLAGAAAFFTLKIARFPQIAPVNIQVQASYTGGDPEEVARTVATPLEHAINGTPGMIYMQSTTTGDGQVEINVTYPVGYDIDRAASDVLTRVNRALPQLPSSVRAQGVDIRRSSRQRLADVVIYGKGYDELFLSNYAETRVIPAIRRVAGVGRVKDLSDRRYAMRIWLDPDRLAALHVRPKEVLDAVRSQNASIAAGQLGAAPMSANTDGVTVPLTARGRLESAEAFGAMVVRASRSGTIRVRDLGRVELGSESYDSTSFYNGHPAAAVGVYQVPGSNALDVMHGVRQTLEKLDKRFPSGLHYRIASDRTRFITASIHEVLITLGIALGLVVAVIFLFLQNWRATLIPCLTIPVALVGALAPVRLLGFSLNTLSMLGLVLAVGLVVDDAIVVVENAQRRLEEGGEPREAARRAISEVAGAVVTSTCVLLALFVPVAFIPGITGQLYNQFALTLAAAVGLSGLISLSLTPALVGLLLRARGTQGKDTPWWRKPLEAFSRFQSGLAGRLGNVVGWLGAKPWPVLIAFVLLAAATIWLFATRPTGFAPEEDQGGFDIRVALPAGSSLDRTRDVMQRVEKVVGDQPEVENTVAVAGSDDVAGIPEPFYGTVSPTLKDWNQRSASAADIERRLQRRFRDDPDARISISRPPSLPGLGGQGGLTLEIEDRSGGSAATLLRHSDEFIEKLRKLPEVASARPTIEGGVPQQRLHIDRVKAAQLGVNVDELAEDLQIYLGSAFANLFNRFGRTYSVYVQARSSARRDPDALRQLSVPNKAGRPVAVGQLARLEPKIGSSAVTHYNTFDAVEVAVTPAHGTGPAMAAIEKLADKSLPRHMSIEWSDVAYQQREAGGYAPLIFGLGLALVYFALAIQYESWLLPLVVILNVPLALFGALGLLALRGLELDVFAQIGLLILIGLAAKNAVLVVSFARERRLQGCGIIESAREAAKLRMRPILMTAFAFILGSMPLAIASGAGAKARISIGSAVVGGMTVAALLTLLVTPTLYVLAERLRERIGTHDHPTAGRSEAEGTSA